MDEGWPVVIGTLRLEERERLWKFRSMIERAKYFADVEVIKITHEDEEKLAVLLLQVRFCSKLKSAHFKCEKDLTMIMGRPVQFFPPGVFGNLHGRSSQAKDAYASLSELCVSGNFCGPIHTFLFLRFTETKYKRGTIGQFRSVCWCMNRPGANRTIRSSRILCGRCPSRSSSDTRVCSGRIAR